MDEIALPYFFLPAGAGSLAILLLYGWMMLRFRKGWQDLPETRLSEMHPRIPVSVLVPVRNEEKNLPRLLQALASQNYPHDLCELIFINDHSSDQGAAILRKEESKSCPSMRVINLSAGLSGKKAALEAGIAEARGELIIQADADILPGPGWISSIAGLYADKKPLLILSPVVFDRGKGFWQGFFALEFLSLLAVTAGSAGAGQPVMCNGASLAYPASLPRSLPDPYRRNVVSGDDMLLLEQVKQIDRTRILFLRSGEALVRTPAPKNLLEFSRQRFRWVSKGRHYRDPAILGTALLVLVTNLLAASLLLLSVVHYLFVLLFLIFILIKSIFDLIILKPVLNYFKPYSHPPRLIPYAFLYPFYVLVMVVGGMAGNMRWKERIFRRRARRQIVE